MKTTKNNFPADDLRKIPQRIRDMKAEELEDASTPNATSYYDRKTKQTVNLAGPHLHPTNMISSRFHAVHGTEWQKPPAPRRGREPKEPFTILVKRMSEKQIAAAGKEWVEEQIAALKFEELSEESFPNLRGKDGQAASHLWNRCSRRWHPTLGTYRNEKPVDEIPEPKRLKHPRDFYLDIPGGGAALDQHDAEIAEYRQKVLDCIVETEATRRKELGPLETRAAAAKERLELAKSEFERIRLECVGDVTVSLSTNLSFEHRAELLRAKLRQFAPGAISEAEKGILAAIEIVRSGNSGGSMVARVAHSQALRQALKDVRRLQETVVTNAEAEAEIKKIMEAIPPLGAEPLDDERMRRLGYAIEKKSRYVNSRTGLPFQDPDYDPTGGVDDE